MIVRTLAVTLLLAGCAGTEPPTNASQWPDHDLTQERPRFRLAEEDLHHGVLSATFGAAAQFWGCLHIVILERPAPEEVVFIDCNKADGAASVVHLVAAENIDNKLRQGVETAMKVPVSRTEAPLTDADAKLVGEAWMSAIELAGVRSGLDSLRIHERQAQYFVAACEVGCLGAVADHPRPETPGGRIVELGKLLGRLADAKPDARGELLAAVRAKATALAEVVKTAKEGRPRRGGVRHRYK